MLADKGISNLNLFDIEKENASEDIDEELTLKKRKSDY